VAIRSRKHSFKTNHAPDWEIPMLCATTQQEDQEQNRKGERMVITKMTLTKPLSYHEKKETTATTTTRL